MLEPPMTTTAGEGLVLVVGLGVAALIMSAPPVPADICCPSTVMTRPGVKVCDPKRNSEFECWITVVCPKRTGASGVVEVGATVICEEVAWEEVGSSSDCGD